MGDEVPKGRLYGEVYLPKAPPQQDDDRFRVRLLVLVESIDETILAEWIRKEMGLVVRQIGTYSVAYDFETFVGETLSWLDLLHFITKVTKLLQRLDHARSGTKISSAKWVSDVQHLFIDQNMAWRIDTEGGVHPVQDGVMLGEVAAVLSGLGRVRYANVKREVDLAIAAFDRLEEPNHKLAIRHTFQAAEGLFRQMFDGAERLTGGAIRQHLKQEVNRQGQNTTASRAAEDMVEAFSRWADAMQPYRHEQGVKDLVHQPPENLATLMMGQGMSYIRWLLSIDGLRAGASDAATGA
jgi:hypothetical protein